jgi:hypothetical protein
MELLFSFIGHKSIWKREICFFKIFNNFFPSNHGEIHRAKCNYIKEIDFFNSTSECFKDLQVNFNDQVGFLTKIEILRNESIKVQCMPGDPELFEIGKEDLKIARFANEDGYVKIK